MVMPSRAFLFSDETTLTNRLLPRFNGNALAGIFVFRLVFHIAIGKFSNAW